MLTPDPTPPLSPAKRQWRFATTLLPLACFLIFSPSGVKSQEAAAGNCPALSPETMHHSVNYEKELLITDPDVVFRSPQAGEHWSFKEVMRRIAGADSAKETKAFFERWTEQWDDWVSENGDRALSRPGVSRLLKDAWLHDRIDLIAIVNRIDLTRFENHDRSRPVRQLGEARFVYEVVNEQGEIADFTLIAEFNLPLLEPRRTRDENLRHWARLWHDLGNPDLSGDQYLAKLEDLSCHFSQGPQLAQVRTNEKIGSDEWEVREFKLKGDLLAATVLGQTPMNSFKIPPSSMELHEYLFEREQKLLAGTHDFAADGGASFLGVAVRFNSDGSTAAWTTTGAGQLDDRAAAIFAFNTCDGCHHQSTRTGNQHLHRVERGKAADLSDFLAGKISLEFTMPSCDGEDSPQWCGSKSWNEKLMRKSLLEEFLNRGTPDVSESVQSQRELPLFLRPH